MGTKASLSTTRAAQIWTEMVELRRELYKDDCFFKMHEPWEQFTTESDLWSIKTYRSENQEEYKQKASVVEFDGRVTLTVDEVLLSRAREGGQLENFILAHEWCHLALRHHANFASNRNFVLSSTDKGYARLAGDIFELEADFGAVVFQCGVALRDERWDSVRLAKRAYADVAAVKKVRRLVNLEVFERE